MEIEKLLAAIEAQYEILPPRLRKAARFVTQGPSEIALSHLRRAAEKAGVSPTTVVGLATLLGFKSYDEFREPFRESLRPGSERYSAAAGQVVGRRGHAGFGVLVESIGNVLAAQVSETFTSNAAGRIEAAGKTLARAKHVYVLGLRSCFAAAFYFRYVCGMFSDNIGLI